MDATSFAYAVLLLAGLVGVTNLLVQYESLMAEGCTLNYVYDGDTVALDCTDGRKTTRLVGGWIALYRKSLMLFGFQT